MILVKKSTIEIIRKNEMMFYLKDYFIFLDNMKIGKIASGESETFEVEPGDHSLHF